jgi:hypothetical protein
MGLLAAQFHRDIVSPHHNNKKNEDIWESGGIATHSFFIISALDGGEWLASCPGHFTAEERTMLPI